MRAQKIRRAVSIAVCLIAIVASLSRDVASQQPSSRPLVPEAQYEA